MQPVSVVIPCFCSQATIHGVVEEIQVALDRRLKSYEIVLVDDGSPDETWDELCRLASGSKTIRAIRLSRNSGQHYATLIGIRSAKYGTVVTTDDDGQNDPEEIELLVRTLENHNLDVVYGRPQNKRQQLHRRIAGQFFRFVTSKFSGQPALRIQSNFRAVRNVFPVTEQTRPGVSIDAWLLHQTSRVRSVETSHRARVSGRTNYRLGSLFRLSIQVFSHTSTGVLSALFIAGMALAGLSVLLALGFIFFALATPEREPGFASIVVLSLLTFSLQFSFLGLVGVFLARLIEGVPWSPPPFEEKRP